MTAMHECDALFCVLDSNAQKRMRVACSAPGTNRDGYTQCVRLLVCRCVRTCVCVSVRNANKCNAPTIYTRRRLLLTSARHERVTIWMPRWENPHRARCVALCALHISCLHVCVLCLASCVRVVCVWFACLMPSTVNCARNADTHRTPRDTRRHADTRERISRV